MVTMEQFKTGLTMYIQEEFVAKVGGLKKLAVVLGAGEVLSKMDEMLANLPENSYVTSDGLIDIDRLYRNLSSVMDKEETIIQNFPMIGDVKFTSRDLDKVYRLIVS